MANQQRTEAELEEIRRKRHEARASQTYKSFIADLSRIGGMSADDAERAAVSVLCALEQRIMASEARHLEAQLPFKLRELLHECERHEAERPQRFGRAEFIRMIAQDLGIDEVQAETIALDVITAVREHISEGEARDVAGQLPPDLADLFGFTA